MTIDRNEVLRYLGQREQPPGPRLDSLVDRAIQRCSLLARPRHVYRIYPCQADGAAGALRLPDAPLTLPGEAILRHMEGAAAIAVLAVTIGGEIEREIAAARHEGMTLPMALDAAASACVEAACDRACEELAAEAEKRGLFPGERFSPGYGDLPLTLQPDILRALDTGRRIGLTCTDSLILLPRKSVTAFVGLFDRPATGENRRCARCPQRETCDFSACGRR